MCPSPTFTIPTQSHKPKPHKTTTFGTPGVREHCLFLKEVPDAVALRKAIVDRFERASMPSVPLEEKKRILSFVVVGGGVRS